LDVRTEIFVIVRGMIVNIDQKTRDVRGIRF
jgi:hypothetical protein